MAEVDSASDARTVAEATREARIALAIVGGALLIAALAVWWVLR